MTDLVARAADLRNRHHPGDPILLPNAWDAASARLVASGGFAVATSSAAVAGVHGSRDHEVMGAEIAFSAVAEIAAAVDVPVTADLEAGYRLDPDQFVARLVAAGAVGCNLEDTDHHGPGPLVDAGWQADRLAEVKQAARDAGIDIVLNARVDVHAHQVGTPEEQLAEAIYRGRRYLEAGADCVYPITVADEAVIGAFVDGVGGPVNILLRPGCPSLDRLRRLGVARLSMGSGLHRVTMLHAERAVAALAAGDLDAVWNGASR